MQKNRKGSAMIVVMCVLVVTVALSLALLLTASILMTNAIRSNDKEQCRINAVTLSDLLIEKIGNIEYSQDSEYQDTESDSVMPYFNALKADSSLEGKLKTIWTRSWKYYSEDLGYLESLDTNRRFTYQLQDGSGLPGTTEVELYFVSENGWDLDDYVSASKSVKETASDF